MPVTPDQVTEFLRDSAGRPLKAKELARALDVLPADYGDFRVLLDDLELEGRLYRVKGQRYAFPQKISLIAGTLRTIRSGAGFVSPDEGGPDLYIPMEKLGSAMDGDRVIARAEHGRRDGRPEGSIVKVLQRARETMVGQYHPQKNIGYVMPEDPKLVRSVYVPEGQSRGAAAGDVVVVRITDWGDKHRGPVGEVEKVLGPFGQPGVDVLAVIYGHELPVDFPAEVEDQAEELRRRGIVEADLRGRMDLREQLIFTIDPADARDHDDALSVRQINESDFEVGIHIADVSFYVREGTALDAEALRRGTSVYLVDRVIPMLPHALSSDICSLLPDQDRLAVSVFVVLGRDGTVKRHRLARSVIRSHHKLAYEDAQAVLDGRQSINAETDEALRNLSLLARELRNQRYQRGSLDLDLPEARVVLSPEGVPVDIQKRTRLESHRLIEDFMLLANETVARKAARAQAPFIYRIHERPDEQRLATLEEFVATFGYRLSRHGQPTPGDLQHLLEAVKGRPEENLISTIVLRSMKQARYSHENLGHFGLASKFYTHFTSPIRRYPDTVAHRLSISEFIDREDTSGAATRSLLPDIARIASERERVAVDAERDSIDLKKTEFMEQHLGSEFTGTISGVTAFGFFVLLDDYFVEGLVHVSSLTDDYYEYYEDRYALIGERTKTQYRLGDHVRVQVSAVNVEERKIDFVLKEQLARAQLRERGIRAARGRKKRPVKRR